MPPRTPCIGAAIDPAGAYGDVDGAGIRRVGQHRVSRGTAESGTPFSAVRMIPQATVKFKVFASVGGLPQRNGLTARPNNARAPLTIRLYLPHPLQGCAGVLRERDGTFFRLLPRGTKVVGVRHRGTPVFTAQAYQNTGAATPGVQANAGNLMHEEVRSGKREIAAVGAGPQPQSLFGAHCKQGHLASFWLRFSVCHAMNSNTAGSGQQGATRR